MSTTHFVFSSISAERNVRGCEESESLPTKLPTLTSGSRAAMAKTPEVHDTAARRNHRNTYPCDSWAELSLQLSPCCPTCFSTSLSHPARAPQRSVPSENPRAESPSRVPPASSGTAAGERRPRGEEPRPRSCQSRGLTSILCEPSSEQQIRTASPPPSSAGNTTDRFSSGRLEAAAPRRGGVTHRRGREGGT